MPAPINYMAAMPNPFESAVQGLRLGADMENIQMKRQENQMILEDRQRTLEQKQQQQQYISSFIAKPVKTAADYADMMIQVPTLSEQFKSGYALQTAEKQQATVSKLSTVFSYLENGKNDLAVDHMDKEIAALTNSNAPPDQIQAATAMRDSLKLNPEVVKTSIGLQLAALPGGDKLLTAASTMAQEKRAGQLHTPALRKAVADATSAEAKAVFAKKQEQADLDQKAAALGLTNQQKASAIATASKLNLETQKLSLELKALKDGGGLLDPDKRFDYEQKLRKEYSDQTKDYQDVKAAYGRVQASQNTAAGDIALIFNYMKMLDPGSTVREGEFANAQNAGGVGDTVINLYNKLRTGERLNASQRLMFNAQAKGLFVQAGEKESKVREGVGRVAKSYGLNSTNVFYEPTETAPTPPSQLNSVNVSGKTYERPTNFTDEQWAAYAKAMEGKK